MWSITKKELGVFFSSAIAYLVIGLFLIINSLLLWILDGEFNIPNSGFGDLNLFFDVVPWLLIFLIPALCMRSFSDEIRTGTIEILLTKPIPTYQIILGKFFGVLLLVSIALLPTVLNLFAIQQLLDNNSQIDWGVASASYFGLFLLSTVFTTIGLCCSIKFKNQVAAFIAAVLFCYLQYDLWGQLAKLTQNTETFDLLNNIGIKTHYFNISKGMISITDSIYLIGISGFFIYCGISFLKQLKQ